MKIDGNKNQMIKEQKAREKNEAEVKPKIPPVPSKKESSKALVAKTKTSKTPVKYGDKVKSETDSMEGIVTALTKGADGLNYVEVAVPPFTGKTIILKKYLETDLLITQAGALKSDKKLSMDNLSSAFGKKLRD